MMNNRFDEQKEAILAKIKLPTFPAEYKTLTEPYTGAHIQEMLDEFHDVYVPDTGAPIVLDAPIIMRSGYHLKAAKEQVFIQAKDSELCLLRNENIQDGWFGPGDPALRDRDISVEGGKWHIRRSVRCLADPEGKIKSAYAAIIICSAEQVLLRSMIIHDSEELCGTGHGPASYSIQICDVRDFTVEDMDFVDNHRDGVHVNGPASFGHLRHIRGQYMGDDMIALNAWDWDMSAITFGTIENLVVEDAVGGGNELRLLPGQKIYPDGTRVDCDIRNIFLEKIRGVYTFKLYTQPNIANVYGIRTEPDVSGTVGTMENINFRDIVFTKVAMTGFNDLPIDGMFDVGADIDGLYIDTVNVEDTLDACFARNARLVSVGPLSATWKTNPADPATWGEVFDPDAVCHANNIHLRNIRFAGEPVSDKEKLTRTVVQHINPDYPKTTPKGGTGYGVLGDVYIED